MELKLLRIFILVFLLYCASAKRYSGGGSRSWGSRSRPSTSWGHTRTPSHTSFNRPSSTSFNSGRTSSSSNFLHAESGRPSQPRPAVSHPSTNSHVSHPRPSVSHAPSAPPHSTNTHTSNFGRPSSVVNDRHQQSSAPVSHHNPYERQPASNPHLSSAPYVPSGGHSIYGNHASPPYPINQPNHPHPTNIGSSSFPSNAQHHPTVHHPSNTAYNPSVHHPSNTAYNPTVHHPSNTAYNPSVHHPSNTAYNPTVHHPSNSAYHPTNTMYQPPSGGYHHPSVGYQPSSNAYHPSNVGYQPPMHHYQPATSPIVPGRTVYVVQDSRGKSSGPGLGSIIAGGVAGGVAAGATNAIVDHAISSIFRPSYHNVHSYPSAPPIGTPTSSVTHTTNNYYYGQPAAAPNQPNNQPNSQPDQNVNVNGQPVQPAQVAPSQNATMTANNQGVAANGSPGIMTGGVVSRTPEQQPANPADATFVSDDDLMKISEELFDKLNTNVNQYVELNLQSRVNGSNDGPVPDQATEPLFIIKSGLDSIPTVSKLKVLYDNYQRNHSQKEIVTFAKQEEENAFLDEVIKTPIMKRTLNWLSEKHFIKPNDSDQKELLKNVWFTVIEETSSGFERIFLSENFGENGILGMQNWIYFAHMESQNNADYLGYVDMLSLSGKGALLRVNYRSEGVSMQNVPVFVGTPPELELALYTICIHARYNNYCPISLGGAKFLIFTHAFEYNNKLVIDAGYPSF